jgi:hypothetical protein
VNAAFDVADHMVNEGVQIAFVVQAAVRTQRVGIDDRARQHALANVREQRRAFLIWHDDRAHAAALPMLARATLDHPENHSLPRPWAVLQELAPAPRHDFSRARAATNERLVGFDLTGKRFVERFQAHSDTNAVEHEPRRLLSHANRASDLARRDAVLAVSQHPNRWQPFGERDRRVFEDCSDLGREVALTVLAPEARPRLRFDRQDRRATATHARAGDGVGPAHADEVVMGAIDIREVTNGFEEGRRLLVHASKYTAKRQWRQVYSLDNCQVSRLTTYYE